MKKLLFAFCFLFSLVAQAQDLIFLCQPKSFASPNIPGGYNVVGISASSLNYKLGDTTSLWCYFQFYRVVDSVMVAVPPGQNDRIPKKVTIGPTTYNLHAMLFSGNKAQIFAAAMIFATAQGYTLLDIEDQTYLNNLYPE